MTPRNDPPDAIPAAPPSPPMARPGPWAKLTPPGPWANPTRSPGPPLHTPLVWMGGGALLVATVWLTGMIALFRAFGSLFY